MQLRQRDVEQWMSHRRLPIPLRKWVDDFFLDLIFFVHVIIVIHK